MGLTNEDFVRRFQGMANSLYDTDVFTVITVEGDPDDETLSDYGPYVRFAAALRREAAWTWPEFSPGGLLAAGDLENLTMECALHELGHIVTSPEWRERGAIVPPNGGTEKGGRVEFTLGEAATQVFQMKVCQALGWQLESSQNKSQTSPADRPSWLAKGERLLDSLGVPDSIYERVVQFLKSIPELQHIRVVSDERTCVPQREVYP